jgi:hypothetical protein
VAPAPHVSIRKVGDVTPAAHQTGAHQGDTIAYSYVVTNTGNVTLASVEVHDPTIGAVTCPTPPPPGLAPGTAVTCSMRAAVAVPVIAIALTLGVTAPLVSDELSPHDRSAVPPATAAPRVVTVHRVRVVRIARHAALVIPALGVRAPLAATGAVGQPGTASLTIPSDIHTVGWWDGVVTNGDTRIKEAAPAPGDPGVALIAGHVNSASAGAGALYNLRTLHKGDTIRVIGVDRRTTSWKVISAPQYTVKTALPRALFRTSGPPRLALVTCGGPFDAATGHYLDNVIVWAAPAA